MKACVAPARPRLSEQGFSLIEVAIALLIIGLFVGTAVAAYNVYMTQKRDIDTKARILTVEAALTKFVIKHNRYPLPADRDIPMGTLGFGREVATVTTNCSVTNDKACQTAGPNVVYIGDVPFASLGIHYSNTTDLYGNKLTYAVTAPLTSAPMTDTGGRIRVRYLDGTDQYAGPTGMAHYFVFSPGEDHQGAYDLQGNAMAACGVPATNGLDTENCNNDNIFRSNIDNNPANISTFGKVLRAYRAGPNQFDDWPAYKNSLATGMWAMVPGLGELVNTNTGLNVLVGTPTFYACVTPSGNNVCVDLPKTRIEVQGTARADAIRTKRMCYENSPSGCVPTFTYTDRPRNILSPSHFAAVTPPPSTGGVYDPATGGQMNGGILCSGFRALRGFRIGDELCTSSTAVLNPTGYGDCNTSVTGLYPTGIDAAGHVVCN